MVTRIDRLARGIGDLHDIVRVVRTRGASLRATEQPIDTSTAAGKTGGTDISQCERGRMATCATSS
jgi:DNA invertase Pin-like site-specific DNA recombinase